MAPTLPIQPGWAWTILPRRMGETSKRCAKLVGSFPRRPEAAIAAKGALTKYWVKGLNTYGNAVFQFFMFNTFTKHSKNLFLPCHCGVLCVDWWEKKIKWIHFRSETTKYGKLERVWKFSECTVLFSCIGTLCCAFLCCCCCTVC